MVVVYATFVEWWSGGGGGGGGSGGSVQSLHGHV